MQLRYDTKVPIDKTAVINQPTGSKVLLDCDWKRLMRSWTIIQYEVKKVLLELLLKSMRRFCHNQCLIMHADTDPPDTGHTLIPLACSVANTFILNKGVISAPIALVDFSSLLNEKFPSHGLQFHALCQLRHLATGDDI